MSSRSKTLVLDNGTMYQASPVSPDQASGVGCPGADTRLTGRVFDCYGLTLPVGTRPVPMRGRVKGWAQSTGLRVRFVSADDGETADLLGFLLTA